MKNTTKQCKIFKFSNFVEVFLKEGGLDIQGFTLLFDLL